MAGVDNHNLISPKIVLAASELVGGPLPIWCRFTLPILPNTASVCLDLQSGFFRLNCLSVKGFLGFFGLDERRLLMVAIPFDSYREHSEEFEKQEVF